MWRVTCFKVNEPPSPQTLVEEPECVTGTTAGKWHLGMRVTQ